MKTKLLITSLSLTLTLTSCSSMKKSVSLGLTSGAITGLAVQSSGGKNNLQGAAIGAAIGGIASYFTHKGLKKRDDQTRRETLFNLDKFGVYQGHKPTKSKSNTPFSIAPATVEQDYIETHVQDGKRLIEGHRVWTISDETQWIPTQRSPNE
jgi:hypothetical protein